MAKLLMITGLGSAKNLAADKKGAFYYTLEGLNQYWERIDIVVPWVDDKKEVSINNVSIHGSPFPEYLIPLLSFLRIKSICVALRYGFFLIKKACILHKDNKFDLITVHDYPPFYNGFFAYCLWKKIRVPYVLEIFHIPGDPRSASIKEWIYKIWFRMFIKLDVSNAKAVRVMNKNIFNFLVNSGVPEEKIKYIPAIYLDQTIFKPMNLPKEYDIIFVGRLEKNKGIDIFINTVKEILKTKKDLRALIVGDGSLKVFVGSEIKSLGLDEDKCVHGWAGSFEEVAKFINKSRILVMPSYNEGGPRVVVEAMACGVPVLATKVGIVPDIIKDKESGIIIDWDPKDIAKKALELLNNETEYKLIQKNGMEISRQFERKAAIKNYAEKLQSIIS